MNEKFNKNAKVEKLTKKVGRGARLIVIGPLVKSILHAEYNAHDALQDVANTGAKLYYMSGESFVCQSHFFSSVYIAITFTK